MTKEEFKNLMKSIPSICNEDVEEQHKMADRIMCEALIDLGYKEGVLAFQDMEKWYA